MTRRGAGRLAVMPQLAQAIPELSSPPTPDQAAAFAADGVGVARGLFDAGEIGEIAEVFTSAGRGGPVRGVSEEQIADLDGGRLDPLKQWPRMLQPHRRDEAAFGRLARRWMLSERFRGVLAALMGEQPVAAQSMFYFKPPGGRGQALHQDNLSLRVAAGRPDGYATCVAAWIAVDRADADNGALVIVPGTGRREMICPDDDSEALRKESFIAEGIRLPEGAEEVVAELEAGDVLFFNGSLVHGSHANKTADRFRRSLIFHYVPASCSQVATFYHPLLDFDGRVIDKDHAPYLNVCGGEEGNDPA